MKETERMNVDKAAQIEAMTDSLDQVEQGLSMLRSTVEKGGNVEYVVMLAMTEERFVCIMSSRGHPGQTLAGLHLRTMTDQITQRARDAAEQLFA